MPRPKKNKQTPPPYRLTVPMAEPYTEILQELQAVHGDLTRITRASILMFREANEEERASAMRRLADFERNYMSHLSIGED